jgi:hypothetical protein
MLHYPLLSAFYINCNFTVCEYYKHFVFVVGFLHFLYFF